MNMALPMFIGLARTERSRRLSRCFKAAVPMGIIAVLLTYSRGALLGLIAVLAAMVMKSRRRLPALIAALVLAVIVVVAAPGKWMERMQTLRDVHQDQSAQARFLSWTFSYRLVRDHPVLGGGFQTHTPELYLRYDIPTEHVQGPHSIYFQVLGEHGFPGLMLFLLLAFSCWWSSGRLARQFLQHAEVTGSEESRDLAEYAKMVQLSLIPFLISGAFLGLAYFDLFYQLVATVILLKSFAQRQDWSPEADPVAEENPIPALAN
jgi:probable O-glycosylation ligase (exosortase A-associated)